MTSVRSSSRGPAARFTLGAVAGLCVAALLQAPVTAGPSVAPVQSAVWSFEETFDGLPSSPQVFSSLRWDIVAGSNDLDGIVDGQAVDGVSGDGTIEAGHGSDCGAPIGRGALSNHILLPGSDFHAFQHNTRPQLTYVCNNHMMTTVKAGYGVVSLMPRQPFDWAGRTGTFEFEVNTYAFGREWWDMYIVPEDEMLLEIVMRDEGGTGEQLPRRAVKFSFRDGNPSVAVVNNYQIASETGLWQKFQDVFPNDPSLTDPRIRRTVRLQLSQSGWGFAIQKEDGTFWEFAGTFPQPLSFTRGLARIEHHAYNPTKDGIFGTPWSQFTYHWDNIRFDGPVLPASPAFEPGPHFVNLMRDPDPNFVSPPVRINVASSQLTNTVLVGHIASMLNFEGVDPQNSAHWRQFRLNGGAWQDIVLVKNAPAGERSWSTFRNNLTGVVAGTNVIEFRYPQRPSQATWHWNGYRVKDLEIQVRSAAAVLPPAPTLPPQTPAPTAAATPTPTAQPTAAATPTRTPTPTASPGAATATPGAATATPGAATATPGAATATPGAAPTTTVGQTPAPTSTIVAVVPTAAPSAPAAVPGPTSPPNTVTVPVPIIGPITITLPGTPAPAPTASPAPASSAAAPTSAAAQNPVAPARPAAQNPPAQSQTVVRAQPTPAPQPEQAAAPKAVPTPASAPASGLVIDLRGPIGNLQLMGSVASDLVAQLWTFYLVLVAGVLGLIVRRRLADR